MTRCNTLKSKKVGFSEAQAEAMAEGINAHLVTKHTLDQVIKDLESRLIIKFGAMLVVAVGVLTAILKL